MRSYDPDWKILRKRAHLVERHTNRGGYQEDPRTLCGKSAKRALYAFEDDPRCRKCEREVVKVRAGLRGEANVAFLEERSFSGIVPGAFHWSGSLKLGGIPAEDLSYQMTYLQARASNRSEGIEEDDLGAWRAGSASTRFFTQEGLRERAVAAYRECFPEARALFASYPTPSPCEVLDAPDLREEDLQELSSINARWDALGRHEEEGLRRVEADWEAALERLGLRWD